MKTPLVGASARTRLLLACGAVGPLLFIFVFLLEGITRPGYNAWRQVVSALSLGELGWVQSLNFLVCGLFLLGFAVGLRFVFREGSGATIGPLLLFVFGIGLIGSGLFVMDPDFSSPKGGQEPGTLHGMLHTIAFLVTFSALITTTGVLARRFTGNPAWPGWARYSLATGFLVVVFLLASAVTSALEAQGLFAGAPVGLLQRLAIIPGWIWIALLALRLLTRECSQRGDEEVS